MSPAALLGEQFLRALLGLALLPHTSPHYAPGRSLLGVVDGAIFMVGLVMTMLPGRRRGAGLLALLSGPLPSCWGRCWRARPR